MRRFVHPIVRGTTPVALIDIEAPQPLNLDSLETAIALVDEVVIKICERRSTLRLLYELQRPVTTDQNRADYYSQMARIVSQSSGMEFVAIREWDDEDQLLRCVAADGLGVEAGLLHELDLGPIDNYPTFQRALSGETVPESTISAGHLGPLRELPHLASVRSFVALPIAVGDEYVGALSVAARCPYEFSRIELRGFETITNAIGVAMANFKNQHTNLDEVRRLASTSASQLSDLLAQAARHEAKGYLDNAQKLLYIAQRALRDTRVPKSVTDDITDASQQMKDAHDSLDKMRTNELIRPGQSPVRTELRELVKLATRQVSGELDERDITVGLPSAGVYVQVIPEAVTLALLHLLQNSIHAFGRAKGRVRKQGRRIDITVASRQVGSQSVEITFADNATGIDPSRLSIPVELRDKPWEEALFERGVTGSNGTGFGLNLVRTLLDRAGGGTPGTVNLIEYKNRVVFAIVLPAAD